MVGGGGPGITPSRAGPEAPGFDVLARASLPLGPRTAAHRRQPAAPSARPWPDGGSPPSWCPTSPACPPTTGAGASPTPSACSPPPSGEPPVLQARAWVWSDAGERRSPGAHVRRRLRRLHRRRRAAHRVRGGRLRAAGTDDRRRRTGRLVRRWRRPTADPTPRRPISGRTPAATARTCPVPARRRPLPGPVGRPVVARVEHRAVGGDDLCLHRRRPDGLVPRVVDVRPRPTATSLLFSTWLFHPAGFNLLSDTSAPAIALVMSPVTRALRAGDRHERGLDADPGPDRPVHVLAVAALGAMGAGRLRGRTGLRVLRLRSSSSWPSAGSTWPAWPCCR